MKSALTLIASITLLMAAMPAHAQFQKPEDAVKYRKAALSVMGTHFGRLGAMVNGRLPFDANMAVANAQIVADISRLPWAAFGPGTESSDSKAKPEVWSEAARFKDLSEKTVDATGKLTAAAKTGNIELLKAAFGATAGSCKSCHDVYRAQ